LNTRVRTMMILAAAAMATGACTERVVVDRQARQATILSSTPPKTTGKHKRGLRVVLRDVRTGYVEEVHLPRGACPGRLQKVRPGREVTVRYVTWRYVDQTRVRAAATTNGLWTQLC